jgi:early secretory antigenic target protein ESAT-6
MSTQVNFSGMDNTAAGISGKAKTLEARIQQMENDLKPMQASWDGAARDAYHAAQLRWDTAARDLNAILNAVGIAVNESGTGYRDTERLNTNAW